MLSRRLVIRILLVAFVVGLFPNSLQAADYYSITSGNWNSPSTWSSTPGGLPGTTIPSGNNDAAFIENGHTVTVTASVSCRDLFFTGAAASLVINASVTLTIKFTVTLYKQVSSNSTCTITGAGTLDCKDMAVGSDNNAVPTVGSSTYTHTVVSSVANLIVGNDITINSYFGTVSNLRNGVFSFESGIISIDRNITTNNNNALNTSTFTMANGAQSGTLLLKWSTPFTLSATGINTINLNGTSSLVNYSRSNTQTALATTYTNLTLSGSSAKTISGIVVNGILSMEGTATAAGTTPTFGTSSALRYMGSSAQTTGIEFPTVFNGSGGVIINNVNGVTLNSNRTIGTLLTFVNGRINTGTFTMSMSSASTVAGAGAGKYINGNLQKGVAAGSSSKSFEIGDASVYAPVTISFTGTVTTAGDITARTTGTDHPNLAASTFNAGVTVNRFWTLTNSGVAGFSAYNATFNFVAGDVDPGADYNYFYVGNYYLGTWYYPAVGALLSTSTQANGLTQFGDFQLGERPVASFRTRQSGNWNQVSTWESFDGTSWLAATSTPTSASGYISIRNSHTVTNTGAVTVDQVIIDDGGRMNLAANMTVNDGPAFDFNVNGILDCSTFSLTGAGSFLLDIGGNLIIGSVSGITLSGATGNIQTATRTFSTTANYTYNGGSAQVTGNGLPSAVNNLTINNLSGLTLTASLTINGTLFLNSGAFSTGATTLTFQTSDIPISKTLGTITTSPGTNLTFGTTLNTGGASFTIPSATFTTDPTINNLTINRVNSLTLNDQILSVIGIVLSNGPFDTNNNLVLLSSATGTALIDGSGTGQITGNVTMQRYLPSNFGYKYLASPFQASFVSELGDDMNLGAAFPSVYKYDESRLSSGWVSYINPVNLLNPMQGYSVNFYSSPVVPNTVDITGIVNDGPMSVTLYNNNRTYTKGFNLVGNPYPSPINWNAAGWTKTNIDDALYFFKASGTDQYGGSYSSYVNGNSSDGVANAIIPSMQGFFVRVSPGTYPVTGTLGFTNNVRVTSLAPPFFKSVKASAVPLVRITATFSDDPLSSDPAVIYFDENGTEGMDNKLDALKLFNTDLKISNIYSVSNNNDKLSISALPPITGSQYQVPLGIKVNRTGTLIIKLKDVEEGLASGGIFLSDVTTGLQQDMLGGNQYSIYLPAGEYLNRFFLKFGSVTTSVSADQRDEKMFKVFNSKGVLKVEVNRLPGGIGDLLIFNILGQKIFSSKIFEPGSYDYNPGVKEGIYIITFISGNERFSQKIYIGPK